MSTVLLLPLAAPLVAAATCLLAWRRVAVQRGVALTSAGVILASGIALTAGASQGIVAVQIGNWPAPFGITLVADLFSAVMVAVTGLIGLAIAIYSLADVDEPRESFGYHPLVQVLLMGVCGAFLTGDLFNLYVWFEVMLMASFVLMALGGESEQIRGGIKYVTLNLVASAVFLAAVGILYGLAGTLNLADLADKLDHLREGGIATALGMLFFIAFGIKAAVFPLFFWLPASYHVPPAAVSALFAGLLTKVGTYAMIRVFTLVFIQDQDYVHALILVIAGFTMVTGVLGAVAQYEFRRLLAFHIISQIGYVVMGLGLAGLTRSPAVATLALAGSIYFLVHNIFAKTNLFLISGVASRLCGSAQLKHAGGLARGHPGLAALFLISAFALAGMPPLSGFFGKFSLVRAGLEAGQYAIVATGLAVSLLTLFSMTKIWAEAFWKPLPDGAARAERPRSIQWQFWLPMVLLAATTAAMGIAAEPAFRLATRAAEQLLDRQAYVRAVLGDVP